MDGSKRGTYIGDESQKIIFNYLMRSSAMSTATGNNRPPAPTDRIGPTIMRVCCIIVAFLTNRERMRLRCLIDVTWRHDHGWVVLSTHLTGLPSDVHFTRSIKSINSPHNTSPTYFHRPLCLSLSANFLGSSLLPVPP